MIELAHASSGFSLGLAGAGHCLGMCGGIAAALNLGGTRGNAVTAAYHGGRIASYTVLGGLLGLAAGSIDIAAWTIGLRYLAGLLLIGMGLYIADWWQGMAALERMGARLWHPIQKLGTRWLPVRHWPEAFALGLCWGLMPCGLIYSSLALAATAGDPVSSASIMFFFGLGTLPAMLATSLGAESARSFLRQRGLKIVIAILLITAGLWTLYITAAHSGHGNAAHTGKPPQHHHD